MKRSTRNALAVGLAAVMLSTGGPGVWTGVETAAAPVPKAAPRDGVIVVAWFNDREKPLAVIRPDGTAVSVPKADGRFRPRDVRLSADGRRCVLLDTDPDLERNRWCAVCDVRWFDPTDPSPELHTLAEGLLLPSAALTPDGKRAYVSHLPPDTPKPKDGESLPFQTWVYDLATGKRTDLGLPAGQAVVDVSADGDHLLTASNTYHSGKWTLSRTPVATLQPDRLVEAATLDLCHPRLSPDGRRLLYVKVVEWPDPPATGGPFVFDLASKAETQLKVAGLERGTPVRACWDPDGRRIALYWQPTAGKEAKIDSTRVSVFADDGGESAIVLERDRGSQVTGLDWR